MKNIIRLENVSWEYSHAKTPALKEISMEISEGGFVLVLGGNGSGKTSFCRLLNGLIPHSLPGKFSGKVIVDGIDTASSSTARLAEKVGMSFDESETQLFTARVFDEVAFALENILLPPDEIKKKVDWALHATGLFDYADFAPASLSGGQKKRLTIAAAIAMAGRVLVLDDPLSQLDPVGVREILSLIDGLRRMSGLTVIMTASCGEDAAEYAHKVCLLKEGKPAAYDTPGKIFSDRELLKNCSVQGPGVSEFALCMDELGKPLPKFPVSLQEAEKSVTEWYSCQ